MSPKLRNITVSKRDGSRVPFDISKIKKSIEFAVDGMGVNPLQLEASLDNVFKNGMSTSDIQDNIIRHALLLTTPETPQWSNVAGRALAMQLWGNFPLRDKSFSEVVVYNIRKGFYSDELQKSYSDSDIAELGKYIKHERDLEHSYASLITAKKKYLGKYELNQHMHMVSAMRFGQLESADTRVQFVKELYDVLSLRKLSLATPFMSNLRKGGNVASCFIVAVEDDLDSIFNNVHRVAKISKNGGGVGIYLGKIRAKGSMVNGAENAAGTITQWVKIFNDTLVAVNQQGKRAGAGTVAIPIWHNDILDFLDMQTEHGDVRSKAYDVFPQVCVPDLFMERDENQQHWYTFCPYEVRKKLGIEMYGLWGDAFNEAYATIEAAIEAGKLKVFRKFNNAREITKIAMRSQFETGMPYVAFTDEINRHNPNKHEGYIPCTNLCTESYSVVTPDVYGHVCNLCSVNLSNIDSMEELAKVSRLATRMLDHGIDLTNNPDDITAAHNNRFRTIGIGQMGLHDYLAKNFKTFSNLDVIGSLSACIEYNAIVESIQLAKEKGKYPAFEGSDWDNGAMLAKFQTPEYDFLGLASDIKQFGMRNSQLTSPAPTTSTSQYQDCSASILPVYDAFFLDANSAGNLIIAAKYLDINPIAYGKTFAKHSAKEIIDVVSTAQKHIDTGCSMELIFDQNDPTFNAKVAYDAIHYAHKKKTKAIYYIRTVKKNATLTHEEPACIACSG